jgi:hypothetical protein
MTDLQLLVNGKEIGYDSDINKNILYGSFQRYWTSLRTDTVGKHWLIPSGHQLNRHVQYVASPIQFSLIQSRPKNAGPLLMTMHSFSNFDCPLYLTFTSFVPACCISLPEYVFNTDMGLSNVTKTLLELFSWHQRTAKPVSPSICLSLSSISVVMVIF